MDEITRASLENIYTRDREKQTAAYFHLLAVTEQPVAWAYDVWDGLVASLNHKDNHVRSIAAQLLCNLARSDPEGRILRDFDALLAVTKDVRSVTARHSLQALWKIGQAGEPQRQKLVEGLERRFQECLPEKNCTLIRYDILQGLRNLYDVLQDESLKEKALALTELEEDPKYRKKYSAVWRK